MSKRSWTNCERCNTISPSPYKVTVRDPEYTTGYTYVVLCVGCGKDAQRMPLAQRTRDRALTKAVAA